MKTKKHIRLNKTRKRKKNKNNNHNSNKFKKKNKVKIAKLDKGNDINYLASLYNKSKIYKTNTKTKKTIRRNDVNNILDTKVEKLLSLFDNERLKNISPQKDFHELTNITWLNKMDKNKESRYYIKFDNFRIAQDRVFYNLIQNVKEYISLNKKEKSQSKFVKSLSNFFDSWNTLSNNSIHQHMKQCVKTIDDFCDTDDKNNLWKFMAHLNKNEIISHSLPFYWYIAEDKKNTKMFANYIKSPTFGLYNVDTYFQTTTESKKEKQRYLKYITSVFNACLGKKDASRFNAEDVFNVEYKMIMSFSCNLDKYKKELQNEPNGYNKISSKNTQKIYNFNWEQFAKKLGYKTVPESVIVLDTNYLKCVTDELLQNWTGQEWRSYWVFIHLSQMIRFDKKLRHIYYNYYEKELFGQNAIFPDELYPIFGLSSCFDNFLSQQFRKHNYNEKYVEYAKRMASNLRQIFLSRLKKNKWITEPTKKYAIKKVVSINLQIDTDCKSKDPVLPYKDTDPWGNMMMFFNWKLKQQIKLNNKPIVTFSQIDWKSFQLNGTQTYIVNAFYIPTQNRIFIPLAFLQKPFIDLDDRGIEYNLANLGYVLAHEFSHSLDVIGSKYDHNGNLKDWWTAEDKKKYKKLIDDVNSQYSTFMAHNNIKTDVSLFIGENIADITGVNLCSDYLMLYHSLHNNLESVSTTFLSLKTFYNFYAIQMRQHISDNSLQMLLKTNPHPPDKYRINCPLARLKLFKKIYNINKKDKMFWQSKIDIW